ncbi:MAG: gliding motility-associated C-terminal domain-containing protein [Bacteroidetes bacterium]|nr:gliding motility-associated C-terminal domain-containing protein [Bacteroidota bacterium]
MRYRLLYLFGLCLLAVSPVAAQVECGGTKRLSLVPNPDGFTPPGELDPGQTLRMCFRLEGYLDPSAVNWFHGVQFDFGPGWDRTSVRNQSAPVPCIGAGQWGWFPAVTSGSGTVYGPGFFFDTNQDGNPGNNYGDDDIWGSCFFYNWEFCFDITVRADAAPGTSLAVTGRVLSDSESGNWFGGAGSCQDPVMPPDVLSPLKVRDPCTFTLQSLVPVVPTCADPAGGSVAIALNGGTGPFAFSLNGGPFVPEASPGAYVFTGLSAGSGSLTARDLGAPGCQQSFSFSLAAPVTPVLDATRVAVQPVTCRGDADGSLSLSHPDAAELRLNAGAWQPLAPLWNLPAGMYSLQVRTTEGCESNVLTLSLGTRSVLEALGSVHSPQLLLGEPLHLTNLSSGYTAGVWDMGDGTRLAASEPSYVYAQPGIYRPLLQVADALGCTDTWQAPSVEVREVPAWSVPNVFSPNNDGLNDDWGLVHLHLRRVQVYARNGQQVWQQAGSSVRWDGRDARGTPVPEGTYTVILHFEDQASQAVSVLLIR